MSTTKMPNAGAPAKLSLSAHPWELQWELQSGILCVIGVVGVGTWAWTNLGAMRCCFIDGD